MADDILDYAGCRAYWKAGRCPCCGGKLVPWPGPDGTEHQPEAVAEGVMFCGRCIGNRHHSDESTPGFLRMMLTAIAAGG